MLHRYHLPSSVSPPWFHPPPHQDDFLSMGQPGKKGKGKANFLKASVGQSEKKGMTRKKKEKKRYPAWAKHVDTSPQKAVITGQQREDVGTYAGSARETHPLEIANPWLIH